MTDEYIEIVPIPDIYADGIADVELLGNNVRLIFFVRDRGQRVVCAKIVRPISSVIGILPALIAAKLVVIEAPALMPH